MEESSSPEDSPQRREEEEEEDVHVKEEIEEDIPLTKPGYPVPAAYPPIQVCRYEEDLSSFYKGHCFHFHPLFEHLKHLRNVLIVS